MKHLKRYNEGAIFDSSTLEDILLEVTDEGCSWDINVGKRSNGDSRITVYINIASKDVNWDIIKPCVLRIIDYLKKERYIYLGGSTSDILNSIKRNNFDPAEYIAGYTDWVSGENDVDPVSLELQFHN